MVMRKGIIVRINQYNYHQQRRLSSSTGSERVAGSLHLFLSQGAPLLPDSLLQRVHIRVSCGIDLCLHSSPNTII
jgi:hypothetical protein